MSAPLVFEKLPTFLTIKQAANMFQVSTKTVRRRVTSREWPHLRVGRQIRLDLAAITGSARRAA